MPVIRDEKELDRVRWAVRRGMLELDLVFEPYVLGCYMTSSEADKLAFLALLECEDADLFTWFLKSQTPDPEHVDIVNKILAFKKQRHS
jgi:succinate dehydrogenase flavin-adding protein (antitoxin of CptAB toxin-antitoxin module)